MQSIDHSTNFYRFNHSVLNSKGLYSEAKIYQSDHWLSLIIEDNKALTNQIQQGFEDATLKWLRDGRKTPYIEVSKKIFEIAQ